MKKKIPQATIERLVLYHRILGEILEKEGLQLISSTQLADRLEILPVQIRKDLSYCGHFGARGIGYYVQDLRKKIKNVLGLQYRRKVAIVGAGNLGTALANYKIFSEIDFKVSALFDNDTRIIGSEINCVKVYDAEKIQSVAQRKLIDIGIIAIPKTSAQKAVNDLISAGVKGIWNFSTARLVVPENVALVNEDFMESLSALSYHITLNED